VAVDASGGADSRPTVAIVLAAGQGTRMRSALPKVLHPAAGRTLLAWVLDAAGALAPDRTVVIVGHGAEPVRQAIDAPVSVVVQEPQLGTGHAVACAVDFGALDGFAGDVLVLAGDSPCVRPDVLAALRDHHRSTGAAATVLTFRTDRPARYGRVVRDSGGRFLRIVEATDASPDELAIRECNSSMYLFDAAALVDALPRLSSDNAQGETYLPDALAVIAAAGGRVEAVPAADESDGWGVNTRADLARVHAHLNARLLEAHMLAGAHVVDPTSTWVEHGVTLDADCRVEPFTVLRGATRVHAGAVVGPHAVVVDAVIGPGATVGPFASLRGGSVLEEGAKAGTFVELKKTRLAAGAKAPHLSYLGDADVGEGTNVAAGNITANYDGTHKHRTTIGARVKTGVHTTFVAPVHIGDDAVIAAGSTITHEVPPGALGVARERQRNIEGYTARRAERSGEAP
jgi:bifunctional UDP-N-acetylglucosamine pyrophosphorylase/glucosamine-1-phosphate N-acetyltransferase